MSTISAGARQELVVAVAERYQTSTAAEKRRILDEFVALTGYHRKHAIRVLNGNSAQPATRRGRRCVYDEAVTEGLVVLWEASDRLCGKRLKALLPVLVPGLERHGHLCLDPRVREQLMAVSAATIDRRLGEARAVTTGQRRHRRSALNSVQGRVPVRTFGDWQDPAPGFVEADLVAHCGGSMAGSFVWTLVLTDIASGLDGLCGAPGARSASGGPRAGSASRRTSVSAPGDRHRQRERVSQRVVDEIL